MKARSRHRSLVLLFQALLLLSPSPAWTQTAPPPSPGAATLESLVQAYQAGLTKLQQDRDDKLSRVNTNYLAALDRAQQDASTRADLAGALAVKAERDRWTQGQQPTPADKKAMPARLQDLRNSYDRSCLPILDDFKKRSDTFAKQYLASLDQLQRQLLVANQLEKAVAVKTEGDRIRALIAPAAPAPASSNSSNTSGATAAAPTGTLTPEAARRLFNLSADKWTISGDVISGHYGNFDYSGDATKSAPLGPAHELQFSFQIKSKWYHSTKIWIDDESYSYSRGHWDNHNTMINADGKESRLPGIVEDPDKWASVAVVVRGGKIKFYYNGKLDGERDVKAKPAGHIFNVSFRSHNDDVQLKNVIVEAPALHK